MLRTYSCEDCERECAQAIYEARGRGPLPKLCPTHRAAREVARARIRRAQGQRDRRADLGRRKDSQYAYESSGAREVVDAVHWARVRGLAHPEPAEITVSIRVGLNGYAVDFLRAARDAAIGAPPGDKRPAVWNLLLAALAEHGSHEPRLTQALQPTITPEVALANLIQTMFSAERLRTWFHALPDADRASEELPGSNCSLADLAAAVVEVGQQHGLIVEAFFDHLVAARPKREQEIRAVQALWKR